MSSPKKPDKSPEDTKSTTDPAEVDPQDANRVHPPEVPAVAENPVAENAVAEGAISAAVLEAAPETQTVDCSVVLVPVKVPEDCDANKQDTTATMSVTESTEESMDTDAETTEMEEDSNLEIGSKSDEMMEESSVTSQPMVSPDDSSTENSGRTEMHLVVINTGDNPRVMDYHISKRNMNTVRMEEGRSSTYDVNDTMASNPPTMDYDNRSQGDSLSPMDSLEEIKAKLMYRILADADSKSTSDSPTSEAASSLPGDDTSMSKQDISFSDPAVPGHSSMLTEMEKAESLVESVDALHVTCGDEPVQESISMWGKRQELDQMETSGALTDSSSTPTSLTTTQSEESSSEITDKPRKLSAGRITAEVYSDPNAAAIPDTKFVQVPKPEDFLGTLGSIGEEVSIPPSTKGKMPIKRLLVADAAEQDVSPSKRRCRTTTDATTSPIPVESPECESETSPIKEAILESPLLFELLSPKKSVGKTPPKRSLDDSKGDADSSSKVPKIDSPSASTSVTEKSIQTESGTEETARSIESGTEETARSIESGTSESGHSMESITEESGLCMESITEESILSLDSGTDISAPPIKPKSAISEFIVEELEADEAGPSVELGAEKTGQSELVAEETEQSVVLGAEETKPSVNMHPNEEPSAMEQDSEEKPNEETGET